MEFFIGHSLDYEIRWKASSGGIGSHIIRHLLESGEYGTSMTFIFNKDLCQYEPKLIFNFSDYNNCGSIYQDTDNIRFIKENLDRIKNGIVVTCMPCQVNAIKTILQRNNIRFFFISLCCSGQTSVEGTWQYYKMLGVKKEDVQDIQYRGDGWPSGIRIRLKDGSIIRRNNYTYPWTLIHRSLLYRPKRCLYCTIKTNPQSDISLADPWLKEYIGYDKIGNSIIISNNRGSDVLRKMISNKDIFIKKIDEDTYIRSQLGTIAAKIQSGRCKRFNKIIVRMGAENSLYKKCISLYPSLMEFHIRFINVLKKIMEK